MDVWETFGIKSLSPSQLTKWAQDRGQWYASARAKVYEDAGPAAWRGDAVEAGLYAALSERGAPDRAARDAFEVRSLEWSKAHDGEVHPDADEEEAKISPALARAIEGWKSEGIAKPVSYQSRAEGFLPKTRVSLFGKPDFALHDPEKHCVDLKTANQLPSVSKETGKASAKIEHAMAASFYAHARSEKLARIFYVSTAGNPKDGWRLITLDADEIAFYVRAATEIVRQIEATLIAAVAMSEFEAVSREEALAELCRPNLLAQGGGLFPIWKQEYAARALAAVPAWN